MLDNKRLFPRVKVDLKVGFEFVKWNETSLDHCESSYEASITDISAKGASLKDMPHIDSSHMKKLSTGINKIRLNLLLSEDNDPINTFARLVWSQQPEEGGTETQQYGFEFIDIPCSAFERIKKFVDSANTQLIKLQIQQYFIFISQFSTVKYLTYRRFHQFQNHEFPEFVSSY